MFSATKGGSLSGYQISRSVRLRSSASAYFNKTPASAGSLTTWTLSVWAKRGTISASAVNSIYSAGTSGTNDSNIAFNGDVLDFFNRNSSTINGRLITTQVFRDPSSWYHIVFVWNTTSATSSNRMQIYVNGSQVTAFSTATYPSQNQTSNVNNAVSNLLGLQTGTSNYYNGYLTEVNFIDGQALTPSSFGQYNAYGVWSPTKYNGTYGTNGFYLNFSDNSAATAAAIGKDYSGNGNNWTPNNISVTSGVTYDSMLDVPTQWSDGGNGRGNYAVLNPLSNGYGTTSIISITDGNLNFSDATSTSKTCVGSMTAPSGKWYFEMTCTNTGVYYVGLIDKATNNESWYRNNGTYSSSFGGGGTSGYSSWTTNDVIGVAWDVDAGKIWFAKNNTWQSGSPSASTSPTNTFTAGLSLLPEIYTDNSAGTKSGSFNFGQRPFSYTPPSGFKALNTLNLPTPTIANGANYFAATTYTGTGASRSVDNTVNNVSFQPDLVWVKGRSGATDHALYDAVRGVQLQLESNTTTAETTETTGLTAFNSNGFTVGALAQMNTNTATYVGWQWKEGATQGFDIVTYTGTGSATTVAHSLGVAPAMIIAKGRGGTSTSWWVYHKSLGTPVLEMNSTAASATYVSVFNNTAPTSSVFSVGTGDTNRSGQTQLAYLFAEVAGFSRFGSYTGNGSADGPFIFTGFRPRWFLVKLTSAAGGSWHLIDTARDPYNQVGLGLYPNSSNAESSDFASDILSNGLKIRNTQAEINGSGSTYIFAAFAENPFKYSLAR